MFSTRLAVIIQRILPRALKKLFRGPATESQIIGQHDVEQDQIRMACLRGIEARLARGGFPDVVPRLS